MAPKVGSQRRDVRKHIQQALAKYPGAFLSVGDISRTITDEYDTVTRPSSRAITLNLFDGDAPRSLVEGVESVTIKGVKGARSIVAKKPVTRRPRKATKAIDFTSPSTAKVIGGGAGDAVLVLEATNSTSNGKSAPKVRPGRQGVNLNPGVKTHQGILDRLTKTVYCNVMLEPNRDRRWTGANEMIEGREEFVAWLNKKNGPYFDGERFEMIDVIGANKDQRENSGINKWYSEWLDSAEDFRISSALKMMIDTFSFGVIFTPDTGKWRFSNGYEGGSRGSQYILFLAKHGKISVRKAHEVFLDYVLDQLGEDFMSRIDLVDEDGIRKIEEEANRISKEKRGFELLSMDKVALTELAKSYGKVLEFNQEWLVKHILNHEFKA